jgi:hypothetical protein
MGAMSDDDAEVARFLSMVRDRLHAGRREYGDQSFTRPPAALIGEIEEELLDVVGWSAVLFARVQRLRRSEVIDASS